MSKIYTAGIAALFAAVTIAATTVPAAAKHHGHHHHHHGHHHGHNSWGWDFDFGSVVLDDYDPAYCVDRRGRIFVCDY